MSSADFVNGLIWEKAIFAAAYLDRAGHLNRAVVKKCVENDVELQTVADRISELGFLEEEPRPKQTSKINSYIAARAAEFANNQKLDPFSVFAVSNAYVTSTKILDDVVKVNTSFASFYVPDSFGTKTFRDELLNDQLRNLVESFQGAWRKKLMEAGHPLYERYKDQPEFWKIEESITRLSQFEGHHNPFFVMLMLQHLASTNTLRFSCIKTNKDIPATDGTFWIVEGWSPPESDKIQTININLVKKDDLEVGKCFLSKWKKQIT